MLDQILEVGFLFDWISPVAALIQDHIYGPSHAFLISRHCDWSGREIVNLLRSNGIKSWGHLIVRDTFRLAVHRSQARQAQRYLQQAGIPIRIGLVDEPQADSPEVVSNSKEKEKTDSPRHILEVAGEPPNL